MSYTKIPIHIQINNVPDMIKVINKYNVGDSIEVEMFRGQEKITVRLVLEKAPVPTAPAVRSIPLAQPIPSPASLP